MIGKIDEIEELYFGGKFDSIFIAIGYKHPRFKSILIDRFRPLIPMANIISQIPILILRLKLACDGSWVL